MMIILTLEQAVDVRSTALDPIPLQDGTFILPDRVLEDPLHEAHWALLAGLPRREVALTELVVE